VGKGEGKVLIGRARPGFGLVLGKGVASKLGDFDPPRHIHREIFPIKKQNWLSSEGKETAGKIVIKECFLFLLRKVTQGLTKIPRGMGG